MAPSTFEATEHFGKLHPHDSAEKFGRCLGSNVFMLLSDAGGSVIRYLIAGRIKWFDP